MLLSVILSSILIIVFYFNFYLNGILIGLGLTILLLLVMIAIGDKIILFLINAKPLKDDSLIDESSNLKCIFGLQNIDIFYSSSVGANIHFIKGLLSSSALVIGRDLLDSMSTKEIKLLLAYSFLQVKRRNNSVYLISSMIYLLFGFPLILLKKRDSLVFLRAVFNFLHYPIVITKFLFEYSTTKSYRKSDRAILDYKLLNSIFFKISKSDIFQNYLCELIVTGLIYQKFSRESLIKKLVTTDNYMEKIEAM